MRSVLALPTLTRLLVTDYDGQLWGLVLAGNHTTAAAMAWIVKFLAENPDIQKKLRDELHATYPAAVEEKRVPSSAEMTRGHIPYLEAVIEETLRLHATTVTREAMCDTEILGHRVPKGTTVFLVSNGPGFYSPSLPVDDTKRSQTSRAARLGRWDETKDLMTYDPERWLRKGPNGEIEFDGAAGPQMIFGLGPRGCFGKRLAYLKMRTMTTLVVWSLDLLETPQSLSSHAATDGISHRAVQCFIKPRSLRV